MRVLFIDIDTLRADHLGCYGYGRDTSRTIDSIAKDGVVFNEYYTPNAPCLPSRAALISGKFGIHTGAVGHGGTAADMRLDGQTREFRDEISTNNLFNNFRRAGMKTVSVSTFAERHSSWWFNAGFDETYNVGGGGTETAEKITPVALDWLERNWENDNWCMHVHYWDPHTPYRAPEAFGNPFEGTPLPDPWIDDETFAQHLEHVGPHGANEISMWDDTENPKYPRHPGSLKTTSDAKNFIDQYDCGIAFTDSHVKELMDFAKAKGIYEDLAIIVTSDHGENMGELGLYAEHATADYPTCRIPMIIKWPNCQKGVYDNGLHANIDLAPSIEELLSLEHSKVWDGKSYAPVLFGKNDKTCSRDYIVINQCAHVCQRSVRFEDYIYIRTIHGGYHIFDDEMLFDVKNDPHQINNIAQENPMLCAIGSKHILDWEYEMMKTSKSDIDPMWTVLREGGAYHSKGFFKGYIERLEKKGRFDAVEKLLKKYPDEM